MEKKEVLRKLELGSTIAEYDNNLEHYFINTTYVQSLLTDKYDIIIGSKGSGKTAMLMALSKNSCDYTELKNVKLVQAVKLKGDPDFKRVFDKYDQDLKQLEIVDAWKIYVINILWKDIYKNLDYDEKFESYLRKNSIIDNSEDFLSKLNFALRRCKFKFINKFNADGTSEQEMTLGIDNKNI